MAGSVAYCHALGQKDISVISSNQNFDSKGITIVTAGVDYIRLYNPIQTNKDLKLQGKVIYVGRSSMEVFITADVMNGVPLRAIEANFTMVARNQENKAISVPSLEPVTEEDQYLNSKSIQNRARRQYNSLTSLELHPPNKTELFLIHKIFLKQKKSGMGPDEVSMASTYHKNVMLMHPQKRNIHGKVFGGYLMRLAYEQAWTSAYLFSGVRPKFIASDDINFLLPVSLGSLCTFKSTVTYSKTEENGEKLIIVEIIASVVDPSTHKEDETNRFYFVFSCGESKKKVVPVTYDEAIKYIDGLRRLEWLVKKE